MNWMARRGDSRAPSGLYPNPTAAPHSTVTGRATPPASIDASSVTM